MSFYSDDPDRDTCTDQQTAQQAASAAAFRPQPFGVSILDQLVKQVDAQRGIAQKVEADLATQEKVIDILTRHPEFEEFIFVLKNLRA